MNKRARLTRRILREHRRGELMHFELIRKPPRKGWATLWNCTHCHVFFGRQEIPRAYR